MLQLLFQHKLRFLKNSVFQYRDEIAARKEIIIIITTSRHSKENKTCMLIKSKQDKNLRKKQCNEYD